MAGPDRAMLYTLACWTGYRRKELAALTRESLDLDADPPTVTVPAAYTKNGRSDTMPLHPVVVEQFRDWLATRPDSPTAPLFELKSPGGGFRKTAKMMRKDLAAARTAWIREAEEAGDAAEVRRREGSDFLKYRNSAGLYADFHANRHTFITNLGRAGIHPKLAQTLARHSSINLTMNIYSHVDLTEKTTAVGSLPAPLLKPGAGENRSGIGLPDASEPTGVVPQMVPQTVPNACRRVVGTWHRTALRRPARGRG
jgi:integrase/recombinase XerD